MPNKTDVRKAESDKFYELFPYDKVRESQVVFMERAQEAIDGNMCLIAHAPTGIGKTAAALVPAVADVIMNGGKVIFLTSRHAQHKIVIETLRAMKLKSGCDVKVTDLIGKKWLCNLAESENMSTTDFREYCTALKKEGRCEYHKRTYDKDKELTPAAKEVMEVLDRSVLHSEDAKAICKTVCPYDIFMERAKRSDVIIADYFHMFHPEIHKTFLGKIGTKIDEVLLIVDEAHNLANRVRALLSIQLSDRQVAGAINEAKELEEHELAKDLEFIYKKLAGNAVKMLGGGSEILIDIDCIVGAVEETTDYDFFVEELLRVAAIVRGEKKRSYLGGIAAFLERWREEGAGYVRILKRVQSRRGPIYLYTHECLDPSIVTRGILGDVRSAILMSGTLLPLDMYRNVLGVGDSVELNLDSPFPRENKLSLVVKDVTTKFSMRSKKESVKIANHIVDILNNARGNVGVFFPSYSMRDEIYEIVSGCSDKQILLERQNMTKAEKFELLSMFSKMKEVGAALFAVVGANFSEGVSYDGKMMNAAVLVGLPLSRPDLLTEKLIAYYDEKFRKGWEYGYVNPSINRAVQAAGRCIRSEKDRGVIVFLDGRYLWQNYRKVIPKDYELVVSRDLARELKGFFVDRGKLGAYS